MSRYDDPELLQRFRDYMATAQSTRYNPVESTFERAGNAASEVPESPLDVPHIIQSPDELRELSEGDQIHEKQPSLPTSPPSGARAPHSTPEVAGNISTTKGVSSKLTFGGRPAVGLVGSIHAALDVDNPHEGNSLEMSRVSASIGTQTRPKLSLTGPFLVAETQVSDSRSMASSKSPLKQGRMIDRLPGHGVHQPDVSMPAVIDDDSSEFERDSYVNVDTFNKARQEIIEAAAKAGGPGKKVKQTSKVSSSQVLQPGKGLASRTHQHLRKDSDLIVMDTEKVQSENPNMAGAVEKKAESSQRVPPIVAAAAKPQFGKGLTRIPPAVGPEISVFESSSASENQEQIVSAMETLTTSDDYKNADYFKTWPATEPRDKPAARVRKAIITHIFKGMNARHVAAITFGGLVENIHVGPEAAEVTFVDPDACERFCKEFENGLFYGRNKRGEQLYMLVDPSKEVDIVSSRIESLVMNGATRVVQAIGRNFKIEVQDLLVKNPYLGRLKMEHVVDDQSIRGRRLFSFRLCNIPDALTLKTYLERDEDWEEFNIRFGPDPCNRARGEEFKE